MDKLTIEDFKRLIDLSVVNEDYCISVGPNGFSIINKNNLDVIVNIWKNSDWLENRIIVSIKGKDVQKYYTEIEIEELVTYASSKSDAIIEEAFNSVRKLLYTPDTNINDLNIDSYGED